MKNLIIPPKILSILYELASESGPFGGSSHAACIAHKHNIITTGVNQSKTHPKVIKYTRDTNKQFLHAEMDAIFKFARQYDVKLLKKCTLYVIRVGAKGILFSKPCTACQNMIRAFGINNFINS